jgi:hypothetical protein
MSVNPHSTVVGVFSERAMAEQAVQDLEQAGFGRDQIRYTGSANASSTSGGFFGEIKSLFTGQGTTKESLIRNLVDMGVPDDEARYYAYEFEQGRAIVAVKTQDRQQDALNIQQRHGSYNNYSVWSSSREPVSAGQQPSNGVPASSTTMYEHPSEQPTDAQRQATRERAAQESQQAVDTVDTASHAPPIQAAQASAAQEQHQGTERLQALQAQLQETRRQLQDAQARLQAVKKREAELQAAREYETQLQTTQKQLQEAQAQLQATLAELQATEARISQTGR